MEQEQVLDNILKALFILCQPTAAPTDYREADEFLRSIRQQPSHLFLFCQFLSNETWLASKGPFDSQLLSFMFQFAASVLENWIRTHYVSFDKQQRQQVIELTKLLLKESCRHRLTHSAIEKCCKAASCSVLLFSLDSEAGIEDMLEYWWNTFVELGKQQQIAPLLYYIFLEEAESIPSYGSGEDAERRAWLKSKASKVNSEVSSELFRASLEDNSDSISGNFSTPMSNSLLKKDCIQCLKRWNIYGTRGSTADILCNVFEDPDLVYEVAEAIADDVGRGDTPASCILQTCSSLLSVLKRTFRKQHRNAENEAMTHAALEVTVSIVESNIDSLLKQQDNLQLSESGNTDRAAAILELCDLLLFGLQSGVHSAKMASLEGILHFASSFHHLQLHSQIGSHCNLSQLYTFFQDCFCDFIYLCTASEESCLIALNDASSSKSTSTNAEWNSSSSIEEFQQVREATFEATKELVKAVGDMNRVVHFLDDYRTNCHSYLRLESSFFILTAAFLAYSENTSRELRATTIQIESATPLFQLSLQLLYDQNSPLYLKSSILRFFTAISDILLQDALEQTLFQPMMNILPSYLKAVPREASILLRSLSYSSPRRLLPFAESLLQAMALIPSQFLLYKDAIEALARIIAVMDHEEERYRCVRVALQPCFTFLENTMQSFYSSSSFSEDPKTVVDVLGMMSAVFRGLDEPCISCRILCERLEELALLGHHFASHEWIAPEICKVFVQSVESSKDSDPQKTTTSPIPIVIQILNILQSIFSKSDGETCWIRGCIQLIPLLDPKSSESQQCVLQVLSGVGSTCHRCISEYSISSACERQDLIAEFCRLSELLVLYYPSMFFSWSEQIFPILLLGFYLSDANNCMACLRFWTRVLEYWSQPENQIVLPQSLLDERQSNFIVLLLQGMIYAIGGGISSRLIRHLCNLLSSFCQWIALFHFQSSLPRWIQQAVESNQAAKFTVEMRKAFESMLLEYVRFYSPETAAATTTISKAMFRCFVSDICRVGRGEMMDDILYAYFRS